MSQKLGLVLEKKGKYVKGKSSMSKPYFICFNNENIFNSHNIIKSNRNDTPNINNKDIKMSVKTLNNKSFVLRPKNKKINHEKINQILSKKLIYKNGDSFIHDKKKISKNKNNKINEPKLSKNSFHTRIKSFQIDFKDNYFSNNFKKTERTVYEEKTSKKQNISKKNRINNAKESFNKECIISKNFYSNKTYNLFEDIEEGSTKNTKILEQKMLTIDNLNTDEKIILLSDRETKVEELNNNINTTNNRKIYKKINIAYRSKKMFNNSFCQGNRAFSPMLRNKLNNLRKNILVNKGQQEKKDISKICDIKCEYSKTKKENNNKETQNKKKITNLIQKIKEKIQIIQDIKDRTNCISKRNNASKNISFCKERKAVSNNRNGYNPFTFNHINKNNKNQKKKLGSTKDKEINKVKEPITSRKQKERDISTIIQIKDSKEKYNNRKHIYKNNIVRKVKINKKLNKIIHLNALDNDSSIQKFCLSSKSQNDVFTDFVVKTLNKEEQIKDKNETNNNISKIKNPKDLENKKIEKIENLCQRGFSGPGIKKINQDNFFIYNNFMNNPNYIYTGVCDGHGTYGQNVSGYLVYNLPLTINDILIKEKMEKITEQNTPKVISIIKNTFMKIDKNLSMDTRIDSLFSGSTCVSIVFTPSKLICANLGDSRCIIGKYDGKKWFSKNISNDHKPNILVEEERILKKGGRIEPYKDDEGNFIGPKRVWLKEEDAPGLAMSRSFGDRIAHSVGVISEPEITEYSFLHEDKFLILASDGIWEFISSDECINLVKDYYIKKDINGALNFLYKESSKRWIIEEEVIDDITLILIFFNE